MHNLGVNLFALCNVLLLSGGKEADHKEVCAYVHSLVTFFPGKQMKRLK